MAEGSVGINLMRNSQESLATLERTEAGATSLAIYLANDNFITTINAIAINPWRNQNFAA